ncbi:ABC transporter permease [Paenibacillus sp. KQZ6P-2]|uniref:ABC transporter permease n=1 Tax=Paenibacillus mangrovi TaxID=2931978 RepID=A0A9X2B8J9_9BACL|nr:ABC transporter permease [Paenibacillus mangrovi]MCJ8014568.1 ABC transporter permease [Paenibacillus mangrovi]
MSKFMGVATLFKLMGLEWRKLKQSMIMIELAIYLLVMLFLPTFFVKTVNPDFGKSFDSFFVLMQSIQMGWVLFGASLINQVFIEEYKNKTIFLSFTYPLSRQKLFLAKVLLISLLVILATIVSFLLSGIATYVLDGMFSIFTWQLTSSDITTYLGGMIVRSVIITLISFIPLFTFGILEKAVVPAVICSIASMQLPNFSPMFNIDPNHVIAVLCILGALSLTLSLMTAERVGDI